MFIFYTSMFCCCCSLKVFLLVHPDTRVSFVSICSLLHEDIKCLKLHTDFEKYEVVLPTTESGEKYNRPVST